VRKLVSKQASIVLLAAFYTQTIAIKPNQDINKTLLASKTNQ